MNVSEQRTSRDFGRAAAAQLSGMFHAIEAKSVRPSAAAQQTAFAQALQDACGEEIGVVILVADADRPELRTAAVTSHAPGLYLIRGGGEELHAQFVTTDDVQYDLGTYESMERLAATVQWIEEHENPETIVTSALPRAVERHAEAQRDNRDAQRLTAEFTQALHEHGMVLDTQPEFDGQWHRVAAVDDRPGKQSASYRATAVNGHLEAQFNSFRTGQRVRWTSRNPIAESLRVPAVSETERHQQQLEQWDERAAWCAKDLGRMKWLREHPYLDRKNVEPHGLKEDRHGNMVMPLVDVDGKLWSVQRISPNGEKLFTKGGRTKACFARVGTDDERKPIVIAEGYATSASVYEQTGLPVVCALNAGNLAPVAHALRDRYPDRVILIAGDNDHYKEAQGKPNVGKEKSQEAARQVGGTVLLPRFSRDDRGSDWNDLAASQGNAAVRAQIGETLRSIGVNVPLHPFRDDRTYLEVPYEDRDTAKEAGARWDPQRSSWYVEPGADLTAVAAWKPARTTTQQSTHEDADKAVRNSVRAMSAASFPQRPGQQGGVER